MCIFCVLGVVLWKVYKEFIMLKCVVFYCMVIFDYICFFGFKLKDLLERKGYDVEDYYLFNWSEIDVFKEKYNVKIML